MKNFPHPNTQTNTPWNEITGFQLWGVEFERELEHKMNLIIRIKSVRVREHFARRLGFEILGHLCGGHPLPEKWNEDDWLPVNLSPFLGKRKVRDVLADK